jgi:predicted lactoylglutathione lyase
MKLKSAAGIVCYVKDVPKTVEFYKALGFTF